METIYVNYTTESSDPLAYRGNSVLGLLSEYGPNLNQVNTSMTLSELHQFLDYRVESEIAPSAESEIAKILKSVQRPATKERQAKIAAYQEAYLLKPRPLHESAEQGFMPSITLIATLPLRITALPGSPSQMGQALVTVEKKNENTLIIESDGVARTTGLERLEGLYAKANADPETRRLRAALARLRFPVLVIFPKVGELTEQHLQQALYDMNVLATPLTATQALNRDNRSPYNAIVKAMLADSEANLKSYGLDRELPALIRFVKIALEGAKAAENAAAVGTAMSEDTTQATNDLAHFWSIFVSNMRPNTFDVKDNMAMGAPGITGLAMVAHELFYGRAKSWNRHEKSVAIADLGKVDWSRTHVDNVTGKLVINEAWVGVLELVDRKNNGKLKAVMGGAGANNSRMMREYLFKVAGLGTPTEISAEAAQPQLVTT